jgi:hypothetical protein
MRLAHLRGVREAVIVVASICTPRKMMVGEGAPSVQSFFTLIGHPRADHRPFTTWRAPGMALAVAMRS